METSRIEKSPPREDLADESGGVNGGRLRDAVFSDDQEKLLDRDQFKQLSTTKILLHFGPDARKPTLPKLLFLNALQKVFP
jgi:hypothetical protein